MRREHPRPPGRSGVVFAAGNPWDGNRFPDQHMAEALSAHLPVCYVDPPVRGVRSGPLEEIRPGLWRARTVGIPGRERPGLHTLSLALWRRHLRRTVRSAGWRPAAVIAGTVEPLLDVLPGARRVLYGTDDFVAGAALMGVPRRRLERFEAAALATADVVVAISEALAERWRAMGHEVVTIPNGVDARHFAGVDELPWPDDVHLPAPVVGFVGHLSERIDLRLLEAVADRGWSLLLVGPRQGTFELARITDLLSRPNVAWVGPKPYDALPAYLRAIDVGVVPYTMSAFNAASFPLKTLEYLAAGRAVVSTDLPAVRWLDTDLVRVADTPPAFADAVASAAAEPRRPQEMAARRAFAARHTWAARADELIAAARLGDAAVAARGRGWGG